MVQTDNSAYPAFVLDGVWQLSVKAENDNDYYTKYSDHMNLNL